MTVYSTDRIHRTIASESTVLFLDCWNCDGTSIRSAYAHLEGNDDLHELLIPKQRKPESTHEASELLEVLAEAFANEDNQGYAHFRCSDCSEVNRADSLTIGPFEDYDTAVYASGSRPYPAGTRVPLEIQPEPFVCTSCGCETDPNVAYTEGPDAPEIGWEYYECPECEYKMGQKQEAI